MERLNEIMKRATQRRQLLAEGKLPPRIDNKSTQTTNRGVNLVAHEQFVREQEESRLRHHLTRAEKAHLPATLTIEQWTATLDYFHRKCAYCQKGDYEVLEHFIPLSHGKGTTKDNCVPACTRCNLIKQAWNPLSKHRPYFKKGVEEGLERVKAYLDAQRPGKKRG